MAARHTCVASARDQSAGTRGPRPSGRMARSAPQAPPMRYRLDLHHVACAARCFHRIATTVCSPMSGARSISVRLPAPAQFVRRRGVERVPANAPDKNRRAGVRVLLLRCGNDPHRHATTRAVDSGAARSPRSLMSLPIRTHPSSLSASSLPPPIADGFVLNDWSADVATVQPCHT